MSELLFVLDANFERGPQSLKTTPPPGILPGVLTIQPWTVRQKRTDTSRMVSHSRHNSEPTLSRNDSPLGCLHPTLAYRYHFGMGLSPDTWNYGLRMRRECRERFPRHRGLATPTCITAHAWRACHDAWRDRQLEVSFEVCGGENVPGIPGACATRSFKYLVRGLWRKHENIYI